MTDLTIRTARPADSNALGSLAALDSSRIPPGDLLVAEVGGELVAAYSPFADRAIADPFRHTAGVVDLLRLTGTAPKQPKAARRGLFGTLPRFA